MKIKHPSVSKIKNKFGKLFSDNSNLAQFCLDHYQMDEAKKMCEKLEDLISRLKKKEGELIMCGVYRDSGLIGLEPNEDRGDFEERVGMIKEPFLSYKKYDKKSDKLCLEVKQPTAFSKKAFTEEKFVLWRTERKPILLDSDYVSNAVIGKKDIGKLKNQIYIGNSEIFDYFNFFDFKDKYYNLKEFFVDPDQEFIIDLPNPPYDYIRKGKTPYVGASADPINPNKNYGGIKNGQHIIIQGLDKKYNVHPKKNFKRIAKNSRKFESIEEACKNINHKDLVPNSKSVLDAARIYYNVPGNKSKIREYGFVIIEIDLSQKNWVQ